MRNLAAAYRPVERRAAGADVFHTLDAAADGEWVKTSVNMRPDTRRRRGRRVGQDQRQHAPRHAPPPQAVRRVERHAHPGGGRPGARRLPLVAAGMSV